MDNTRVFITGGTGALGSNLINSFPANYQILAPTSMECNILEYEKLERLLQEFDPSIIVHTAAYVDTFGCETDIDKAIQNNIQGTINITRASLGIQSKVVYISSEYVFGGNRGNYTTNDRPDPKNVYGKTKAASEYIISVLPNHQIIRAPFINKIYPKVFTDQYCSRYFLEEASKRIITNILSNPEKLVHISTERISLYDLYRQKGIVAEPVTMPKEYLKVIPHDTSLINNSL